MPSLTFLEAGDDLPQLSDREKQQRMGALLGCVSGEALAAVVFPHSEPPGFDWIEVRPGLVDGDLVQFSAPFLDSARALFTDLAGKLTPAERSALAPFEKRDGGVSFLDGEVIGIHLPARLRAEAEARLTELFAGSEPFA